ncbi:ABC transporter ATP-binding protein [Pusillimonas sp. DMV24BSW_D]|uniref:ABC transporter ATP-binding protein n=1 Tax=Neopusillimonas aestuarii TaxID=2716226 RepID=UPI00140D0414|nr:ABC transporter ATP-binding protein [Pusillimonas sp. DMV24BSW_D]QIM48291.1 ABC transporter ATP-binding protein [Pusillimonas sp. DMV24BSW_D]
MTVNAPPLLSLEGLTKAFGALVANDHISFDVAPGEIVGILGENGAGKSTLMNMISGLITPDSGVIKMDGKPIVLHSPRDATDAGIGMVHQHFKLVGAFTVAENLALGDRRWGKGWLKLDQLKKELQPIADQLGMPIPFDQRVEKLTVGEQQRVEILKVLARRPRLLILDEPTAVLAREERPALFRMVAELAAQGTAVIIISHKLEDILECCKRVVVMRLGKVVSISDVGGKTREDLVRLLVGDTLPELSERVTPVEQGQSLLKVEGVSLKRPNGTVALDDVSFDVRSGEILALCGVDGNGQTELMSLAAGLLKPDSGFLDYWFAPGRRGLDSARVRAGGVCHIPEDRLRDAVLPGANLADNYLLTQLRRSRFNLKGWLRPAPLLADLAESVKSYSVKTPGLGARVNQLSGGNQQKLVLAREMATRPELILAAHPTRGLDVQTIAFVNNELLAARARGAGVLLSSADLGEVWQVADRIMVLSGGRLHGPVHLSETSLHEVGKWMTDR